MRIRRQLPALAVGAAAAAIAIACGGATDSDLFSAPPGAGTSGTSGTAGTSGVTGTSGNTGTSGRNTSGNVGTSGNAGTSGNVGCDPCSSSGVVPSDAGPDTSPPAGCNPKDANACPSTEYCAAPGCGAVGKCVSRNVDETKDLTPVCGCDDVTYWNTSVARIRGANVRAAGACPADAAVACDRDNVKCPGDTSCNMDTPGQLCVAGKDAKGTCWQLPKSCEGVKSPPVRRCTGSFGCSTQCAEILGQRQYIHTPACL